MSLLMRDFAIASSVPRRDWLCQRARRLPGDKRVYFQAASMALSIIRQASVALESLRTGFADSIEWRWQWRPWQQ